MEQQQQQASQVKSSPYYSPMHNFSGGMVLLTNPDDTLHNLELTFRSLFYNSKNELVSAGEPLMNEKGIMVVMGQLKSIVHKITIMGWLKDDEIREVGNYFADTLIQNLMLNRKNYEIKDDSVRTVIVTMADVTAFLTMKRAFEEGDRRFWKGSEQTIRQEVTQSPQKKGLFSKWTT